MKLPAHTPVPWEHDEMGCQIVAPNPYGYGQMLIADIRGYGHLTGRSVCALSDEAASTIMDANASMIVRAVNHHDKLVEALEGLLRALNDASGNVQEAMRTAQTAIKEIK
jgi:hypothetical protein